MASSEELFVGIDVGKDKNDVHVHGLGDESQFHNDAEGIRELVDAASEGASAEAKQSPLWPEEIPSSLALLPMTSILSLRTSAKQSPFATLEIASSLANCARSSQ